MTKFLAQVIEEDKVLIPQGATQYSKMSEFTLVVYVLVLVLYLLALGVILCLYHL